MTHSFLSFTFTSIISMKKNVFESENVTREGGVLRKVQRSVTYYLNGPKAKRCLLIICTKYREILKIRIPRIFSYKSYFNAGLFFNLGLSRWEGILHQRWRHFQSWKCFDLRWEMRKAWPSPDSHQSDPLGSDWQKMIAGCFA